MVTILGGVPASGRQQNEVRNHKEGSRHAFRKPQTHAPEETGALIADLKALETSLAARLVDMSDDRRTQITNAAIHILRTKNAGWKAEAEVRRIAGV
jgi:hypothetical protein